MSYISIGPSFSRNIGIELHLKGSFGSRLAYQLKKKFKN